ncbi:MAG TPA: hypothetical protein GXZ98_03060 [Firmicutes bacterium]|jgi:hypothetical protein|nr:hypothetical protein [Bacillota bacterium]
MRRIMIHKALSVFLLALVLLLSDYLPVRAEFHLILPFDQSTIGVEYAYPWGDFTPQLGIAYDYGRDKVLSYIGASYETTPFLWRLFYGYWMHQYVPGYAHQQGITGRICYQIAAGHSLTGGIFYGAIERDGTGVQTRLVFLDYSKRLYFDWDREVKLLLKTVAGKVKESGASYYTATLKLPVILGDLKIRPWLGFARETQLLTPYFDLADLIRGYRKDEMTGNRGLALAVERQWALFPYSDLPFLGLLNAAVFVDAGGVIGSNQRVEEFVLYKSIGAGLVFKMGEAELHLEQVYNQLGERRIICYCSR